MPAQKRIDVGAVVIAALLFLTAAAALWESFQFSTLGSIFPRVIGSTLLLGSALAFVLGLLGRRPVSNGIPLDGVVRSILLILTILAWIALLEPLGFVVSGVVSFVALALIANRDPLTLRRVILYAIVALVVVNAFDLLFLRVLKVTLPRGPWL